MTCTARKTRILRGSLAGSLGLLLALACSGADGSGEWEDGATWSDDWEEGTNGNDDWETSDESSAEDIATVSEPILFGSCGSTSSLASSAFSVVAVPDHFPVDAAIAEILPIGVECYPFGRASFHNTCDVHDACYGTPGRTQLDCDQEARSGWKDACNRTYGGDPDWVDGLIAVGTAGTAVLLKEECRNQCLGVAEAMYRGLRVGAGNAYKVAQANIDGNTLLAGSNAALILQVLND